MPRSGGSATSYGILFQILGSLHRACELTFDGRSRGCDIECARLIIEPSRGGDLTVDLENCRIVEQWKSRRTHRPWTIREIAKQVFPDLYAAASGAPISRPSQYQFRAEGQIADWGNARALFEDLRRFDPNSFRAERLPDDHEVAFLGGRDGSMTKRRFFLWLARQLCTTGKPANRRREAIDHRRLCHLLANFTIPTPETVFELERKIDSFLKPLVDYDEDVANIRLELCGRLLKLAGQGAVSIRPSDLLKSAGIVGLSLADWIEISKNVRSHSEDVSRRWRWRYEPNLDVRACPLWPIGNTVLVITGESGVGKTWQLASLIGATDNPHPAVIALSAEGSADRDLEKAAKFLWHDGAAREKPAMPFAQLINRIRDHNQQLSPGWLMVLVDNVQFVAEARDLIEQHWAAWGARLAITVPEDVGKQLRNCGTSTTDVVDVDRFSRMQLRDYLRRHAQEWVSLPDDLREQLRLPLLAGLYAKASPPAAWRAQTEYEVFSEAWALLRKHPLQHDHPDDWSVVRDLAGGLLHRDAEYPWSLKTCRDAGLDSSSITRLERIGWLVRGDGNVAIRHARLLNWAIAEALADRAKSGGDRGVDEVCRILREVVGPQLHSADQQLGYVFMDLLWLVAAPGNLNRAGARRIFDAIEAALAPNGATDALYQELFPTVGDRIADLIIAPLLDASAPPNRRTTDLAGRSLVEIGGNAAISAALSLLGEPSRSVREVGMRVLANWPSPTALPILWCDYLSLEPAADESQEQRFARQSAESRCAGSLKSCAVTNLDWLRDTITKDGGNYRAAWLLADILSQIEGDSAESVWHQTKGILAESLADGSPAFSSCVKRFQDMTQIEHMRRWALSGDPRKIYPGFYALCVVNPDEAIAVMDRVPAANIGWWAPWVDGLFHALPNDTRLRLRELISRSAPDAAYVSQAYIHRTFRLDAETLRCLFKSLDQLLDLDDAEDVSDAVVRLLELLGRVATVELIREFELLRGGELETHLAARGRHWLQEMQRHDREIGELQKVLLLIGGTGLTQFVNAQLRHPNQLMRRRALENCCILPDDETINLVAQIALSSERGEGSYMNQAGLQPEAMETLAALGENRSLLQAMVRQEANSRAIRNLRRDQPPMSNDDLRAAIEALGSGDPKTRKRAYFAIGVSGRRDLIPMINTALKQSGVCEDDVTGALWALFGLDANDDASIATFSTVLLASSIHDHRYPARLGLFQSERADARQTLVSDLARHPPQGGLGYDEWLLEGLARYPDARDAAVRMAVKLEFEAPAFRYGFGNPGILELVADHEGGNIFEHLLAEASPVETNFHVTGRRLAAIRALSKRDRDAAFEAAVSAMQRGKHDRHLYPSALVEIDPQAAIPFLCERLSSERDLYVRRSICVALRHSKETAKIEAAVIDLLKRNAEKRAAAAEIIRWMGNGFQTERLQTLSKHERIGWVRRRFEDAFAAHEAETHASQILQKLARVSTLDQWRLLGALFELVPSECLGHRDDPLWLGPALDAFPPVLRKLANEKYRQAKRKIEDDLKRRYEG